MKTPQKTILITGGAGYIGSHVANQLGNNGEHIVILDNLSTGFKNAVLHGKLVIGDTGNRELVRKVLRENNVESVLHFAAHTVVSESVTNPLKYYGNNTCSSRNLLECCQTEGVKHFIFSSTAAVYGIPDTNTVNENSPTNPINAYGMSKLMTEYMLKDLANASDVRYIALRYFNVAGSNLENRIGQSTKNATLLTKVACEAAVGKRESVSIFGTDYPTKDGTGVRDYIHVEDLANAHVKALEYLRQRGASVTLNCGYGHGFSVREVLNTVNSVNGNALKIIEKDRRIGDPPSLVAEAKKIKTILGWEPQYNNLEIIIKTALAWEKKLLLLTQDRGY